MVEEEDIIAEEVVEGRKGEALDRVGQRDRRLPWNRRGDVHGRRKYVGERTGVEAIRRVDNAVFRVVQCPRRGQYRPPIDCIRLLSRHRPARLVRPYNGFEQHRLGPRSVRL